MAKEDNNRLFKIVVVFLLALNTFFLGSIWCSMKCDYGKKGSMCLLGKKDSGKICPLTGKVLDASGSQKGSPAQ